MIFLELVYVLQKYLVRFRKFCAGSNSFKFLMHEYISHENKFDNIGHGPLCRMVLSG